MNPQPHRKTNRAILCSALFMILLMIPYGSRAECCCHFWTPLVRFLPNSTVPVEGELDFCCVSRIMNADSALADIASILRENPSMTMMLVGHADGEENDADALSVQRARRMACELISSYGIEAGRLSTVGKGASQPRIVPYQLKRMPKYERLQGLRINRRVEFRVMGFDWIPPRQDGIAAVRFLSDPVPPSTSAPSFCDAPLASDAPDEAPDMVAPVDVPDTTSIVVDEVVVLPITSPSVQLEALAPMIVPNPIMNDELKLLWLPGSTQGLCIRMMTMDGRLIAEHRPITVAQGARLQLPVPTALASGAYILHISGGTHDWSLRFMKP